MAMPWPWNPEMMGRKPVAVPAASKASFQWPPLETRDPEPHDVAEEHPEELDSASSPPMLRSAEQCPRSPGFGAIDPPVPRRLDVDCEDDWWGTPRSQAKDLDEDDWWAEDVSPTSASLPSTPRLGRIENLLPDAKEGEDEFVMLLPWALRERYSTLLASTEALCAAAELRAAQLEKEARAFPWCFQSFERSWRAVAGPIPLAAAILALLLTLLLVSPLGGALQLLTVEVAPQNLPPMGPAALAQPGRCHLCVAALVAAEVNALAQVGALSQELVSFETSMGDFDEKLLVWRGIGPDPLW
ncbi:unnamed protein product, partial [Polarella glacialis]